MALPSLDPHPYGCPICVATTPANMPEVITAVYLRLRDLLFPSVHVINPSKGQSYPILNLHVDEEDERPRVVIFPGWEDNRESVKRRLGFGRQMTLLKRIHDAGVRGERLEDWRGSAPSMDEDEPLNLSVAVPAPRMVDIVHDLYDYLGDQLRMTVTTVEQEQGLDLHVLKLYAPTQEKKPRIVLLPGWTTATERASDRVTEEVQLEILGHIAAHRIKEVPVEAWGGSR